MHYNGHRGSRFLFCSNYLLCGIYIHFTKDLLDILGFFFRIHEYQVSTVHEQVITRRSMPDRPPEQVLHLQMVQFMLVICPRGAFHEPMGKQSFSSRFYIFIKFLDEEFLELGALHFGRALHELVLEHAKTLETILRSFLVRIENRHDSLQMALDTLQPTRCMTCR